MSIDTPTSDTAPAANPFAPRGEVRRIPPTDKPKHESVNDAMYGPMPDYATDPAAWERRVRMIMHGCCKRRGMSNEEAIRMVVNGVCTVAADRRQQGKLLFHLKTLSKTLAGRGMTKKRQRLSNLKPGALNSWYVLARGPNGFFAHVEASDDVICAALGIATINDLHLVKGNQDQAVHTVLRYEEAQMAKVNPAAEYVPPSQQATTLDTFMDRVDGQPNPVQPTTAEEIAALANSVSPDEVTGEQLADYFDAKAAAPVVATSPNLRPDYANDAIHAQFAIPKHIAKELDVKGDAIGLHIRNAFNGPIAEYIKANGPNKAYDTAQAYIAKVKAEQNKPVDAPVSQPTTTDKPQAPIVQPAAPAVAKTPIVDEVADKPVETSKPKGLPIVLPIASITTLTGIKIGEIPSALDSRYPANAYREIKLDGNRKGTDISQQHVRDRFDRVFGTHGIGWKFEAHGTIGAVRTERATSPDGEVKEKYRVTLIGHIFKYRIVLPDGSMEWVELSPMSDTGENRKESYAFRSAFTALLKQTLRSFGGFNHLKAA